MQQKIDSHVFHGMKRDIDPLKHSPEYFVDAHNIRITTRGEDTEFAVTTEKSTKVIEFRDGGVIRGNYLGHAILNNIIVVFTYSDKDRIYAITRDITAYTLELLYEGSLNFNQEYPIQTLPLYENELIQKVYWVDGLNQPRMINIKSDKRLNGNAKHKWNDNSFNFCPTLALEEKVSIKRYFNSSGVFPAGTVQYALSYSNKYGQETNFFYQSPLIYNSYVDRGASPEDKLSLSYQISIANTDVNFEYVNIYSIIRTSLNGIPEVKRYIIQNKEDKGVTTSVTDTTNIIQSTVFSNSRAAIYYPDGTNSYDSSRYDSIVDIFKCNIITITPSIYYIYKNGSSLNIDRNIPNLNISLPEYGVYCVISKKDYPNFKLIANSVNYKWHSDSTDNSVYIIKVEPYTQSQLGDSFYSYGEGDIYGIYYGEYDSNLGFYNTTTKEVTTGDRGFIFTDTNIGGESIDPTKLLYIGGEDLVASSICQKDGTLFLGDVKLNKPVIPNDIKKSVKDLAITHYDPRELKSLNESNNITFTLSGVDSKGKVINPTTFKAGEIYRLGVQFQYKTGSWSEPLYVKDFKATRLVLSASKNSINLDRYSIVIPKDICTRLYDLGYKKVRTLFVYPEESDKKILCQGVLCPTVYSVKNRNTNSPYSQSSWFIRPYTNTIDEYEWAPFGSNSPAEGKPNTKRSMPRVHEFRNNYLIPGACHPASEIQGVPGSLPQKIGNLETEYSQDKWGSEVTQKFKLYDTNIFHAVDQTILDLYSPEVDFDNFNLTLDSNYTLSAIGEIVITKSICDRELTTGTPTGAEDAAGYIPEAINTLSFDSIKTCQNYEDFIADDLNDKGEIYFPENDYDWGPMKFTIFPWQKKESINNDAKRKDGTTRTATLKRNSIFNRYESRTEYNTVDITRDILNLDCFGVGTQLNKLGSNIYYGNVDVLLNPPIPYSVFFGHGYSKSSLASNAYYKNFYGLTKGKYYVSGSVEHNAGFFITNHFGKFFDSYDRPGGKDNYIGDKWPNILESRESIRMKYKTCPHMILNIGSELPQLTTDGSLHLAEIVKKNFDTSTIYGGTTEQALLNNEWCISGEPVLLNKNSSTTAFYEYGDTFIQKYEFLKCYPYTLEDENSITEILSFTGEFRFNVDGRYDKNKFAAPVHALSEKNFNLYNSVYNQRNNFFTYRILDSDVYRLNQYRNTIIWSQEHLMVEDIDSWTNISMANSMDFDGNKGFITSLNVYNNEIYAFQNTGISRVLFNTRTQINPTDGVPIEISNNYKVNGKVYISENLGCTNKYSICSTPLGVYFIETSNKNLYLVNTNGLNNISTTKGMSSWFYKQDNDDITRNGYVNTFYDFNRNDLYISNFSEVLNFSEKMNEFISFFNYGKALTLFNLQDKFYGFTNMGQTLKMWEMFADPKTCNFFNTQYSYDLSFISNQDNTANKLFTNLEVRADWRNLDNLGDGAGVNYNRSTNNYIFFDTIRVSNEYQDSKEKPLTHLRDRCSNLKNKFRVWRIDLPRDSKTRRDRISNLWTKIMLKKNATNISDYPMILHDLSVQYYV